MSVGVASHDRQETKGEEVPMGQGLEGSHLGLQSVISFDTYLDTPDTDLKDTAGGWVKVHGEPAGGGDLRKGWASVGSCLTVSQHSLQIPVSFSPIVWAG